MGANAKANRIAIVAALERELRPLRRNIGNQAIYYALGVGREGVMRELPRFIEEHKPEVVILTGFAGGLEPGLESGALVLATASMHAKTREEISLENRFFGLAVAALERARIFFHQGKMLTVERVIATPEEKNRLWKDFSALAVEMEAWWAAQVAGDRLICLKAVVDPAEWGLPRSLADGPEHWQRSLSRPWEWPRLLHLARAARRATEALVEAMQYVVEALAQAQLELEVAR